MKNLYKLNECVMYNRLQNKLDITTFMGPGCMTADTFGLMVGSTECFEIKSKQQLLILLNFPHVNILIMGWVHVPFLLLPRCFSPKEHRYNYWVVVGLLVNSSSSDY